MELSLAYLRSFQINMRSVNEQFYQILESYTADEFLWIGWVAQIYPRSYFSIFIDQLVMETQESQK